MKIKNITVKIVYDNTKLDVKKLQQIKKQHDLILKLLNDLFKNKKFHDS